MRKTGTREKVTLWQRRYEAYKAGGLKRKELCRRFKVKLSTLDYWFARLRRESRPEGLVELKGMAAGPTAASCLTLVMAEGVRLEIPQGCDLKLLADVIGLLGGR